MLSFLFWVLRLWKTPFLVPSTISSESSVKNSLSGGLLGLFSVLSSCWIFVDTLLLTGTPTKTKNTRKVTHTLAAAGTHGDKTPHV